MRVIDLSGKRFGKMVAIEYAKSHRNRRWWLCECDCGIRKLQSVGDLRGGKVVSCGCHKAKITSERNINAAKHNQTGSSTYITWLNMRRRCDYNKDKSWKYYGARGISVCPEWSDFNTFIKDMGPRPQGKTLDRINPNGNYEPSNCRWATPTEQANNKRLGL